VYTLQCKEINSKSFETLQDKWMLVSKLNKVYAPLLSIIHKYIDLNNAIYYGFECFKTIIDMSMLKQKVESWQSNAHTTLRKITSCVNIKRLIRNSVKTLN